MMRKLRSIVLNVILGAFFDELSKNLDDKKIEL